MKLAVSTLDLWKEFWKFDPVSTAEIVKELEMLPRTERANVAKKILQSLCRSDKVVTRIMQRIENPDIPEDVWRGIEDTEDGRIVDMETALHEKPPRRR
jgi:hypothetical protein